MRHLWSELWRYGDSIALNGIYMQCSHDELELKESAPSKRIFIFLKSRKMSQDTSIYRKKCPNKVCMSSHVYSKGYRRYIKVFNTPFAHFFTTFLHFYPLKGLKKIDKGKHGDTLMLNVKTKDSYTILG